MENGESQSSGAVVPGCDHYVRSTIPEGLAGIHCNVAKLVGPDCHFSLVKVHSRNMCSPLTQAHARGHTGVLRHGDPLLFRFLPKQNPAKNARTFFRFPPKKRSLALGSRTHSLSFAMGAPSHRETTYGATSCRRIESINSQFLPTQFFTEIASPSCTACQPTASTSS